MDGKYGNITINFNNCNLSILYTLSDETNLQSFLYPSPADELCSSSGNNARLTSGTKTSPILGVSDIEAGDTYHAMPLDPTRLTLHTN